MGNDKKLNDIERLALAQALYKSSAALVSTKDPTSLRARVDRGFKELYDVTGSRTFDVKLRGQNVGTYSIKFSKPKPQEDRLVFKVSDYEQLARWFGSMPDDEMREFVAQHLAAFAEWVCNDTGELADGCELSSIRTFGGSGQYIGGTLKIDNAAVAEAMRGELPQSGIMLIEGVVE